MAEPNSAESVLTAPNASSYTPMSFEDFYKSRMETLYGHESWRATNGPYSFVGGFNNLFTGERKQLEQEYQLYVDEVNRKYEQAMNKYNSALAAEAEKSKYKLGVQGMLEAGLNPYAIYGLGHGSQASAPVIYGSNSAKSHFDNSDQDIEGKDILSSAIKILASIILMKEAPVINKAFIKK